MKKLWNVTALLFGILLLTTRSNATFAQAEPLDLTKPVHGQYLFPGTQLGDVTRGAAYQLFVADTLNGNISVIKSGDYTVSDPVWSTDGYLLAYREGFQLTLLDIGTSTHTVLLSLEDIQPFPLSWNHSNTQLLYKTYSWPEMGEETYTLRILDLSSLSSTTIFEYTVDDPLVDVPLPTLPTGTTSLTFDAIMSASWNPVFENWILVTLRGLTVEEITSGDGTGRAGVSIN